MKTIKYDDYNCNVVITEYRNNKRKAIQLIDVDTGEPIATPTINIPDEPMFSDEVVIKTYDYPRVLDALITAKVVFPPHRKVETGYVTVPVCYLVEVNNTVLSET
jgi:hypothetical protein